MKTKFIGMFAFLLLLPILGNVQATEPDIELKRTFSSPNADGNLILLRFSNLRQEGAIRKADLTVENVRNTWVYVEQEISPSPLNRFPVQIPSPVYLLGPFHQISLGTVEFPSGSYLQLGATSPVGVKEPWMQAKNRALLGALAIDLSMRGFFTTELPANAFTGGPLQAADALLVPFMDESVSVLLEELGDLALALRDRDAAGAAKVISAFVIHSDEAKESMRKLLRNYFTSEQVDRYLEWAADNVGNVVDLPLKASLLNQIRDATLSAPPYSWVRLDAESNLSIKTVTPRFLTTLTPPQTQRITLIGKGFTQSSTLTFYDGQTVITGNPTKLSYVSPTELKYDIATGTQAGTWTVKVVNGALESDPFAFTVTAATDSTSPVAPIGLSASAWASDGQISLDWTNPSDPSGIAKAWLKIGSIPNSATDGIAYRLPANKPLRASLPVSEGPRTVHLWLEDGAGNRDHNNRATISLGVDATSPVVQIISPAANPPRTTQSTLVLSGTYSDNLSGVTAVRWRNFSAGVNGDATITGMPLNGSWVTPAIALAPGVNVVGITAADAAGNIGTASMQITYATPSNSSTVTVLITPADAVNQGAQWRINAGEWRNSGFVEQNVPTGPRFIDFKNIPGGFRTPAGFPITVTAGQSITTNAAYSPVFVADPPIMPGNPVPAHGAPNVGRAQPRFVWTGGAASGEVEYAFCLDTGNPLNPDPPVIAGFGAVTRASYQYSGTLQPATTYNWRIKTRVNGILVDGPLWRFTTGYDLADLAVKNLSLDGNVEPGATVSLSATVTNQGNFTAPVGYLYFYLSRQPGGKELRLNPPFSLVLNPPLQPGQFTNATFVAKLDGLPAGTSFIDAWIDTTQVGGMVESNLANNLQSISMLYTDGKDPVVTLAGLRNAFVKTGISNLIEFIATDDVAIKTLDFYYSTDAGSNWTAIVEGYVPPTPPSYGAIYPWLIPANLSIGANLQLRVVARDTSGNAGERVSIPYQVRDGTQPTVRIISPNGGEIWGMGSQQQIKWSVSAPNGIGAMDLRFYRNGTVEYIVDIKAVTSGVYVWTLPTPFATTDGRIQITVDDLNGNHAEDFSDALFTVRDTSQPPPAPWQSPQQITVNAGVANFGGPKIATDAAGNLHLAYVSSGRIQYQKRTGTSWSTPQIAVPNATGIFYLQLAVSPSGTPHLIWLDQNQSDIIHATFDGVAWTSPFNLSAGLPTQGGAATASAFPAAKVDSLGTIHVVWRDVGGSGAFCLFYRSRTVAGVWSTPNQITADYATNPALAVDKSNGVHLAYFGNPSANSISYTKFSSNAWSSPVVVASPADWPIDIAADNTNGAHIIWQRYNSTLARNQVSYSRNVGDNWLTQELIYQSEARPSVLRVVVDSMYRPSVIAEDTRFPASVLFFRKFGNNWASPTKLNFDSQIPISESTDAMLDSNNELHVIFGKSVIGTAEVFYNHANIGSTNDVYAPNVTVSVPTPNSGLSVGSSIPIQWSAVDDVGVIAIHLHYSTNSGALWNLIATNLTNGGSFNWIVPDFGSNVAQIRLTAVDATGNTGIGFSGNFTTADSTPPAVAITAPLAGAILAGGGSTNILWNAADNGVISGVDLEFSLDNGATWLGMATNLANTGTYPWTVPSVPTSTLLLRATARDAAGFSATFTSQPLTIVRGNAPPLAPTSPFPLDGSTFVLTQLPNFRWSSSDPDGDALTYYVRFGPSASPPLVLTTTTSSFNPPALRPQRTYFWQVLVSDGKATNTGPLWSFTTEAGTLPPTSLAEFKRQTNGHFEFRFNGLFGENQVVQASTNLFDWFTVATFGNSNATSVFLDSAATNLNRRFYRVLTP